MSTFPTAGAFAAPTHLLWKHRSHCRHAFATQRASLAVAAPGYDVRRRMEGGAGPVVRVLAMAARQRPRGSSRPKGNSNKRRFDPKKVAAAPQKVKLELEEIFYEGRTSWTELIIPTLSILTVVGLIPFSAALARFLWVKYKITSRRISVESGFQGNDKVEIVYRDIASLKYVRRAGGASADCVLELKDGAKLELRAIPNFDEIFEYILDKLDDDARAASGSVSNAPSLSVPSQEK